jgi:hypothetical protein
LAVVTELFNSFLATHDHSILDGLSFWRHAYCNLKEFVKTEAYASASSIQDPKFKMCVCRNVYNMMLATGPRLCRKWVEDREFPSFIRLIYPAVVVDEDTEQSRQNGDDAPELESDNESLPEDVDVDLLPWRDADREVPGVSLERLMEISWGRVHGHHFRALAGYLPVSASLHEQDRSLPG